MSEGHEHEEDNEALGLPFEKIYPFFLGAIGGLFLRIVFWGEPGGKWSAMAGAFIYLAPIFVGAVTVYVAERQKRRSWFYYLWAPFMANLLFIIGTLVIMIEGMICAIVIAPLFASLGALGGLAMGVVCRITNWPKQAIHALAALPIALGFAGDWIPHSETHTQLERRIVIAAPPMRVWNEINNAQDIKQQDFSQAWAASIGVPMPVAGITRYKPGHSPTGYVRDVYWQKNVHFEGLLTDWQPGQYMRWLYRFSPDSFPTHALDDHVMIGGHYFDLHDLSFRFMPHPKGTELIITTSYRVNTQFNFYAERVAELLLGNMLDSFNRFYKKRSELEEAAERKSS